MCSWHRNDRGLSSWWVFSTDKFSSVRHWKDWNYKNCSWIITQLLEWQHFPFNMLTSKLAVVTWKFTTTNNLDFFSWFSFDLLLHSATGPWINILLSHVVISPIGCGQTTCKQRHKFSENRGNMLRHPASWMKSQTRDLQQFVKLIIHICIAYYHPKVSSCGLSLSLLSACFLQGWS